MPLVTIVIPTYNSEEYISETINSVIEQTYRNWELIVIDDCSKDGTEQVVKRFAKEYSRIRFFSLGTNSGGPSAPRNLGIKKSEGQYIAFLDADDAWYPNKLEKQMSLLKSGADVVFSDYYRMGKKKLRVKTPKRISFSDLLKTNSIGNLTGIYNARKLGKFYQKNIGHEDYLMWLEILKRSKVAYSVQEPLAVYRVQPDSVSSNKITAAQWQWRIYREELSLGLIKASYYFMFYLVNAVLKRI